MKAPSHFAFTVAREHPKLRVQLDVESSDLLIERLAQGKLDIMIGRLFERAVTVTPIPKRRGVLGFQMVDLFQQLAETFIDLGVAGG